MGVGDFDLEAVVEDELDEEFFGEAPLFFGCQLANCVLDEDHVVAIKIDGLELLRADFFLGEGKACLDIFYSFQLVLFLLDVSNDLLEIALVLFPELHELEGLRGPNILGEIQVGLLGGRVLFNDFEGPLVELFDVSVLLVAPFLRDFPLTIFLEFGYFLEVLFLPLRLLMVGIRGGLKYLLLLGVAEVLLADAQ